MALYKLDYYYYY